MRLLHPSSWVVLASRTQEHGRAHESLLAALEAQHGTWRTVFLEPLHLDPAGLRAYLHRLLPDAAVVDALMTALQGHVSVLTNPLLVHLFASIAPHQFVGQTITPGLIYRAALDTWLDDELHGRGRPRLLGLQAPPGKTLPHVMRGLLGVLAQGMVEQGQSSLSPLAARDLFVHYLTTALASGRALPGWWPVTAHDQRRIGVRGTTIDVDGLDALVAVLMELCVIQ